MWFTQVNNKTGNWLENILYLLISLTLLTSCTLPSIEPSSPAPTLQPQTTPTIIPQETIVTFHLMLPQPIPAGDSIYINILDEVTGLAFNPQRYIMTAADSTHYTAFVPLTLGRMVKYRYSRQGTVSAQEHITDGRPVRYRLFHVEGPGVVQDTLARWNDTVYAGATGRISGQITDIAATKPVPNILISAGGVQTLTRADGTYLLEGLPPGTHNLVAYALDGSYRSYQQGATVAAGSTTPASFNITKVQLVPVVFLVTVPDTTPSDAPLRIAGNLVQLGNTFSDLTGGVSTLASRMPVLSRLPDGRYVASIELPMGTQIEYKYTLGDGLWNAEHSTDGTFKLRYLTVSSTAMELHDLVDNWGTRQTAPIYFDVSVPSHTITDEGVSIQFNPGYGWAQPVPMWLSTNASGSPTWQFVLISPLEALETLQYRLCRADQCGSADDVSTQGNNPIGNIVSTGILPQTILYSVSNWIWFPPALPPASIPNVPVTSKGPDFLAGIGFSSVYHPSYLPHIPAAITRVQQTGANWLVLQPTWTYTSDQPTIMEIIPSQDIIWPDLIDIIHRAQADQLMIGLFPTPNFPTATEQWWLDSPRDFSWWVSWFDHYAQFLLHHADLAEQTSAQALIIGGDWLAPALPGGLLANGSISNVPADAESRWREMIRQVRSRYSGSLVWALPYPSGIQNLPVFIDSFDQIYVLWSAQVSSVANPSISDLHNEINRLLDTEIQSLQQYGKPITLAVSYPSANGSATGCATLSLGSCAQISEFFPTSPILLQAVLDLQEQTDLYNALFLAVNERPWISGIISMDYFPPVALLDPSSSVNNKPASGVLWYWFPRLRGVQP
mgnify:CR=1 FL=1